MEPLLTVLSTNTHYYTSGIGNQVEEKLLRPWGHVAFHSTTAGWSIAAKDIVFPNGITGPKPDSKNFQADKSIPGNVFVASYWTGQILAFKRGVDNRLSLSDKSKPVNFHTDNLVLTDPPTDLLVCGHPKWVMDHATDLTETTPCESVVGRFSLGKGDESFSGEGASFEEWLVDGLGTHVNASTTAWADLHKDELLVSGLVGRGILRCTNFERGT